MIITVNKEVPRLKIIETCDMHYRSRYFLSYYKTADEQVTLVITSEMNPFQLRNAMNEFINKIGAAND